MLEIDAEHCGVGGLPPSSLWCLSASSPSRTTNFSSIGCTSLAFLRFSLASARECKSGVTCCKGTSGGLWRRAARWISRKRAQPLRRSNGANRHTVRSSGGVVDWAGGESDAARGKGRCRGTTLSPAEINSADCATAARPGQGPACLLSQGLPPPGEEGGPAPCRVRSRRAGAGAGADRERAAGRHGSLTRIVAAAAQPGGP